MADRIEALLALLRRGQDSALLRFSLGSEYRAAGRDEEAIEHLERAVELDPSYSAAFKLLGRCLAAVGRDEAAIAAFERGIEVAEGKGDRQAAKEMRVFLRRVGKRR